MFEVSSCHPGTSALLFFCCWEGYRVLAFKGLSGEAHLLPVPGFSRAILDSAWLSLKRSCPVFEHITFLHTGCALPNDLI